MTRLISKTYYFSVEGQTEKLYLERLERIINNQSCKKHNVKFIIKIQKNPLKFVKNMTFLNAADITHVFDFEELSNEKSFKDTLKNMKDAKNLKNGIIYDLGYSNLSFELWIILHKEYLSSSLQNKNDYLNYINKNFGTNFESMNEYKEEKNFQKVISKIELADVFYAIKNADKIMTKNNEIYRTISHCNYEYFRESPSTNLNVKIKQILINAGIICN